jgi:hypothetical protein
MQEIKLYTEKQMQVAAFLGGPISVGILFYKNFRRLNHEKKGWLALTISILLIVLISISLFANPDGILVRMPRYALPIFYTVSTFLAYRLYMHKLVQQTGKETNIVSANNWKVAGFTLLGVIPTFVILFTAIWFAPEFSGPYKTYKNDRIYYGTGITANELDKLAQHMKDFGYFNAGLEYQVKLEKTNGHLEITIPYLSQFWYDIEEMAFIENEAKIMEADFRMPVIVILRDYNGRGDLITKRVNDPDY